MPEVYAKAQLADVSPQFAATASLPHPPDHDVSVTNHRAEGGRGLGDLVGLGMDGNLTAQFHMLKE